MPIKKENKKLYPENWKELSARLIQAAGNKCQKCKANNKELHPLRGKVVHLAVAHLDHDPTNCKKSNLKVFCQWCHLEYDRRHHSINANMTKINKNSPVQVNDFDAFIKTLQENFNKAVKLTEN